jgi:NitT/TauT family transport system permease protein
MGDSDYRSPADKYPTLTGMGSAFDAAAGLDVLPTSPALQANGNGDLATAISGLDNLEQALPETKSRLARTWASLWPKLGAFALFLGIWQVGAWIKAKEYILPGPGLVIPRFFEDIGNGRLLEATRTTMGRAAFGYGLALIVGMIVGLAVARNRILRNAFGSMITGLQTMPTIAWLPLAVLLFGLSESAINFVVVLGAAPAIANGIIAGVDHTPPILLRAGRVLGARGVAAYRHVILPAALPGFVAGLKQGWAFAWRSLLAGELLVAFSNKASLGFDLTTSRELSDAQGLLSVMLAILVIGIVMDSLVFGRLDKAVRRRWGLMGTNG